MEFNATFLSFLVFVYLMNKILYAPMEKIVSERQRFIDENFDSADKNYERADELNNERDEKLLGAKNDARAKYTASINDFKSRRADIVQQAQNETNSELEREYANLDNVSNETKEGLKSRMEDLANDITEKILGYRSGVQGFDNETVNKILYH